MLYREGVVRLVPPRWPWPSCWTLPLPTPPLDWRLMTSTPTSRFMIRPFFSLPTMVSQREWWPLTSLMSVCTSSMISLAASHFYLLLVDYLRVLCVARDILCCVLIFVSQSVSWWLHLFVRSLELASVPLLILLPPVLGCLRSVFQMHTSLSFVATLFDGSISVSLFFALQTLWSVLTNTRVQSLCSTISMSWRLAGTHPTLCSAKVWSKCTRLMAFWTALQWRLVPALCLHPLCHPIKLFSCPCSVQFERLVVILCFRLVPDPVQLHTTSDSDGSRAGSLGLCISM